MTMALISCSPQPMINALTASYNDQIRPLLDAVDRLRQLKVMQEGIELPTIVVVGDQSSGKSSVLESLAGISLPRGQGICTRVPLIMRLQDDPSLLTPQLHLEYKDKFIQTSEHEITEAIEFATSEIAGSGKGISDTPLTLVVRKKGVPDLTMVDLPGITRVPVHGQPVSLSGCPNRSTEPVSERSLWLQRRISPRRVWRKLENWKQSCSIRIIFFLGLTSPLWAYQF